MARPTLGDGETVRLHVMIEDDELAAIDAWQFANRVPTRSEAVRRLCKAAIQNDPASVGAPRVTVPTTPTQEKAMDVRSDNIPAATSARTAFNTIVDELGYSVNDLRMFASLMDTITQAKLAMVGDSSLLRPGVTGSYLAPIEAEEICFLALKIDHMARKLDEQFDLMTEALSAREARAA